MKFRVSQGFETLGDSCSKTYETREEAEVAAARLHVEISEMVAGMDTPDADEDGLIPTGYSTELDAWARAVEFSDGSGTYGKTAAAYIATKAVTMEVVE
jgi:hypothetical protein